jgi:hypothetical protein
MTKEAMTLALEALYSMKETLAEHDEQTTFNEDEAIKALKEALAKQEQSQPVAWFYVEGEMRWVTDNLYEAQYGATGDITPLYATPQALKEQSA